ncbi:MAG: hypothetical protein GY814_04295, partial [Gammaproteobacteria bacterium]|nr:hypothetical protein [Gammaproteobacteria bacterium]
MSYFSGNYGLSNVIKSGKILGSPTAIPGTRDINGYIDAAGGGAWAVITHSPTALFMNEGTVDEPWVLRWEGTGDATWFGGGTEIPGSTPNRREYTSLAVPANNYAAIATGDVTKLELLAPGEEARYDAGYILHSRFVADLAGIDTVRLMQALVDDSGVRDIGDFLPYDFVTWDIGLSPNGLVYTKRGLPIQAACEIANELGVKNFHY